MDEWSAIRIVDFASIGDYRPKHVSSPRTSQDGHCDFASIDSTEQITDENRIYEDSWFPMRHAILLLGTNASLQRQFSDSLMRPQHGIR